eukprot:COSAG02_NODE_10896_length_1836_cov_2.047784_2_plen_78_part_00
MSLLLGLLTDTATAEHYGAAAATARLLPHLLSIDWQRLPDLNIGHSGFQNSDGGWVTHFCKGRGITLHVTCTAYVEL